MADAATDPSAYRTGAPPRTEAAAWATTGLYRVEAAGFPGGYYCFPAARDGTEALTMARANEADPLRSRPSTLRPGNPVVVRVQRRRDGAWFEVETLVW